MPPIVHRLQEMYWELRRGRRVSLAALVHAVSGQVVTVGDVRLRLGLHLSYTIARAILEGWYEQAERNLISQVLRPEDVVFELGAGLGVVSTHCAKIVGPDRVFAYEGNPDLEPLIRETYALNGVCPTLRMCICGAAVGETNFYQARDFWRSSVDPIEHARQIKVPTVSLRTELERTLPTVLVADIEGGEYQLVQDTDFATCRAIVMEVHDAMLGEERTNAVHARLTDLGFRQTARAGDTRLFLRERTSLSA